MNGWLRILYGDCALRLLEVESAGLGTTGRAAIENARNAILIEVNEDYIPIIERECDVTPGLALS